MSKRIAVFVYGVVCYAIFFVTFLYAVGWVGNLIVPTSIDGEPRQPLAIAFAVNAGLLTIFALQHSVMARPTFKRWWTQFIPKPAERSTYVLFSSLALILLFVFWQPMGGTIWEITNPVGRAVMWSLFAFGWMTVLVTTFLINHFDLFGLRQVWLYLRSEEYTQLKFREPGPYKHVRHPLYVGWLFAFWATPHMTVAHLFFAVGTTGYIIAAIQLEERDLEKHLPGYADYKRRVRGWFIPRFGRKAAKAELAPVRHSN